jgi:hypothetical protein
MLMVLPDSEVASSHPTDAELLSYCENWTLAPEELDEESFQRFEGHFLVCNSCAQRAKELETKLEQQGKFGSSWAYSAGKNLIAES